MSQPNLDSKSLRKKNVQAAPMVGYILSRTSFAPFGNSARGERDQQDEMSPSSVLGSPGRNTDNCAIRNHCVPWV